MWAILLVPVLLSTVLFCLSGLVFISQRQIEPFFPSAVLQHMEAFSTCCAANLCKLHVLCRVGFKFCTTSVVVHVLSSNHPSSRSQGILITAFASQSENKSWLIPIHGCVGTWTPQLLFGLVKFGLGNRYFCILLYNCAWVSHTFKTTSVK